MPDLLSIAGFFAGLYYFIKGFGWLKQKRLIENTPTSKIRSIAMGLVEIYGAVVPKEAGILKSAFSAKDCVYCKYTIEEYRSSGKSHQWVTVKSGEMAVPFFLKDETGAVLVDPKEANMEIPMDFEFRSGWNNDPPQQIQQFLISNGMDFEGFLGFNKTMRYREYIIEPGNNLYVMGTAADNPDFSHMGGADAVNSAHIRIQKGANDKTYYISDRPEKEILKGLRWKSFLGIFGGGVLAVVCFALILYSWGIIWYVW